MRYTLIVKPQAEVDMLEAALWHESKKHGLGKRYLESVGDKFRLITKRPHLFQIRYKNVRFALTKTFPFAIHYIIENDQIFVLAVLKTDRDPQIWKDR